jgi:hypothetical protein
MARPGIMRLNGLRQRCAARFQLRQTGRIGCNLGMVGLAIPVGHSIMADDSDKEHRRHHS